MTDRAEIGVFGGSGFYSLLDDVREIKVDTPYGAPTRLDLPASVSATSASRSSRATAPAHDPAARINYRANVWAMGRLGVSTSSRRRAAGSPAADVKPGDFVVCDQFVDRTPGREQTFFDGPSVIHISRGDPYCPGPAHARDRRRSASPGSRSTNAARSSSSKDRASRRAPSASGIPARAGKSST